MCSQLCWLSFGCGEDEARIEATAEKLPREKNTHLKPNDVLVWHHPQPEEGLACKSLDLYNQGSLKIFFSVTIKALNNITD